MEALNITFIKKVGTDNLDVICANCILSNLTYPYIGNTLSFTITTGNAFVSTFDGGKTGFDILSQNISKLSGNLISSSINQNLSYGVYQSRGSAITSYENEFIEKIRQFGIDISNSIYDPSKNLIRLNFSTTLYNTYNNEEFTSAISKIKQYLTQNTDIQKILTDNFHVLGAASIKYGKGPVKLDKIFAPLFPNNSLGGEERRKTLKKRA